MRYWLLLGFLVICPLAWAGQVLSSDQAVLGPQAAAVSKPFNHYLFEEVLSESVDPAGNVDFGRLRVESGTLDDYMTQLQAVSPDNHPDYFPTPTDRLAYWINAHNAIALRLILDQYPIQDLNQVPDFETSTRYALGNKSTSLKHIEDRLQQFAYHLPGVFFAMTYYDANSPPPIPHAYSGVALKMELEQQLIRAFSDQKLVGIVSDGTCPTIMLSSWFDRMQLGLMNYQHMNHAPQLWPSFLKPFMSPQVQGEMANPDCAPNVVFGQPDTRLRVQSPV